MAHPTLEDVRRAARRIDELIVRTPLRPSEALTDVLGAPVVLKLECLQNTGSFKVRGAANRLLQLAAEEGERGVVAVSSGNHGRAVAHVARLLGVEATICLSERVPPHKVGAIEDEGARIVVAGPDQDDADREARRLVEDDGLTFVHPFDDPRVIAGQGTVGLELADEAPDVSQVLIPLSGGGLAAGIATAVKGLSGATTVIGVSQELGPAMVRSLQAGRLVDVVEEDTLADALAGGLGPSNDHSFAMCRNLLDATVLVSEAEIAEAMGFLWREEGLIVEGGGAVGVAAILFGRTLAPEPTAVVISGGNVPRPTVEGFARHR